MVQKNKVFLLALISQKIVYKRLNFKSLGSVLRLLMKMFYVHKINIFYLVFRNTKKVFYKFRAVGKLFTNEY